MIDDPSDLRGFHLPIAFDLPHLIRLVDKPDEDIDALLRLAGLAVGMNRFDLAAKLCKAATEPFEVPPLQTVERQLGIARRYGGSGGGHPQVP